jgi:phosphoenolpyruvate mutase
MSLKHKILPEVRRPKLRHLLEDKEMVRVLEAHNGLSGLIVNNCRIDDEYGVQEFDGIWVSSLTDSAAKGLPDAEIVSIDSRIQSIEEILNVTNKFMVVDCDSGGDHINFQYTVARLEQLGVSAVIIEDKVFPKRNSLEAGVKQVQELPMKFAHKLSQGKKVLKSEDFFIIARIESLISGKGLEDAIKRAEIYLQHGADGIMIHSKERTPDSIFEFAEMYNKLSAGLGFRRPLVCVPTTYNTVREEDLKRYDYNIVIYANHLLRSAYQHMQKAAYEILINQRSFESEKYCAPLKDLFNVVGFMDIKEQEKAEISNVSAIILAAGTPPPDLEHLQGSPISLIDLEGRRLLEIQRDILKDAGILDIKVVIGYLAEAFQDFKIRDVEFIYNEEWNRKYILTSLHKSMDFINGSFFYIEGDTLFSLEFMKEFFEFINNNPNHDIILAADPSFKFHPEWKTEDLIIRESDLLLRGIKRTAPKVKRIGSDIPLKEADYEFTGIAYFSNKGVDIFKEVHKTFGSSKLSPKDDLASIIQESIYRDYAVHVFEVRSGWLEIDCLENYHLAREQLHG